jgi:hypothetical protein
VIIKRDGTVEPLNENPILKALQATRETGTGADLVARQLTDTVVSTLSANNGGIPTVEQVPDLVEKTPMEQGWLNTAKQGSGPVATGDVDRDRGAAWIRQACEVIPKTVFVTDRFHASKYIRQPQVKICRCGQRYGGQRAKVLLDRSRRFWRMLLNELKVRVIASAYLTWSLRCFRRQMGRDSCPASTHRCLTGL